MYSPKLITHPTVVNSSKATATITWMWNKVSTLQVSLEKFLNKSTRREQTQPVSSLIYRRCSDSSKELFCKDLAICLWEQMKVLLPCKNVLLSYNNKSLWFLMNGKIILPELARIMLMILALKECAEIMVLMAQIWVLD